MTCDGIIEPASDAAPTISKNETKFTTHDFEWLALSNDSKNRDIDLTGAQFTKGINFSFDQSPIKKLKPGETLYLAYNLAAFTKKHGTEKAQQLAGSFAPARLNNAGERIRLKDGAGKVLLDERISPE